MSDSTAPVVSNANSKTWANEQNWIKDVLSKSGTELVQLRGNKSLKIKKVVRENGQQDLQNNTMVYYQSTPLIIKSEQPSQAQLCGSLRTTPSTDHHHHPHQNQYQPLHMQHSSMNAYSLSNVTIGMQQQQQQQIAQNTTTTTTSINHHHQQQQQQQQQQIPQQYLTSIKSELLPPGITLYATTQPATLTQITATNQNVTSSSSSSSSPARPTSTTGGGGGGASVTAVGGRKVNPNKPQFKCEQCGMTFGSKSAHTSHTKSHIKNGEVSLMNGGNGGTVATTTTTTISSNGLELNEAGLPIGIPKTPQIKPNANAATNGGDPYQCNVCQKTFAVPARLIRHYRTHTGERPFECEFCHKLFSVKENLQVHRRIHTKERPYKCDVCGRAFEHSGKLHRHMRIHTGERPHKCSVCEKTFIQSGQLVIHMRTHTGEKPYKCPVEGCGKGFTCSKQLKVHSRTHTGEKPYHCDICFRDFGYNHVLKLHRVQHYGSKCYKCTICDETFKSKKEMEAHIKGHANEMPDDEEAAASAANGTANGTAANGTTSTSSSSPSSVSALSSSETISSPNSPQSPSSSLGTTTATTTTTTTIATKKQRKPRQEKLRSVSTSAPLSPGSPVSPSSSMSPSSSYNSGSRLSATSPTCSVASPTMSLTMETDHHSRDSGVASGSIPTTHSTRHLAAVTLMDMSHQGSFPTSEEMPTDLSISQQSHQHHHMDQNSQQHQQQQQQQHVAYHYQHSSPPSLQQTVKPEQYQYLNNSQSSNEQQQQQDTELHSATLQQQQQNHHASHFELPTINPALLEAATIASRREDDVAQAAIQIMQLHRSQRKSIGLVAPIVGNNGHSAIYSDLHQIPPANLQQSLIQPLNRAPATTNYALLMEHPYDDPQEGNDLMEQYQRGEIARHGLVKGYAPVPKFETSLPNNEIILRQVEAAIAPLRSSTESPERSSSPESDSMMLMADRDVMTLPLRKRKLYMSDAGDNGNSNGGGGCGGSSEMDTANNSAKEMGQKTMRQSSVIQFAKAS